MKGRLTYALLALAVFGLEVIIALFVHDDFVRPYLGDSLAVVLVYLGLRAITPLPVVPAIIIAIGIAFAIEFGQLFHLIDALGLGKSQLARVVLGGVFDVKDFACYAAGAAAVLGIETLRKRNAT